jgi:hypothetical protein
MEGGLTKKIKIKNKIIIDRKIMVFWDGVEGWGEESP